ECEPRFDYGRADHEATAVENGVMFRSAEGDLLLRSTVPLEIVDGDVRATWTGRAGDVGGAVLESAPASESAGPIDAQQVLAMFNQTVRFWRDWLAKST